MCQRYMYGGRGYGNDFYDQIYVLSLPSFRWIKVRKAPYQALSAPSFGPMKRSQPSDP